MTENLPVYAFKLISLYLSWRFGIVPRQPTTQVGLVLNNLGKLGNFHGLRVDGCNKLPCSLLSSKPHLIALKRFPALLLHFKIPRGSHFVVYLTSPRVRLNCSGSQTSRVLRPRVCIVCRRILLSTLLHSRHSSFQIISSQQQTISD